jgi:hypothetical protein
MLYETKTDAKLLEVRPLNQPIRLPGLKPGVCSGLILSGAFNPGLKIGVWRRRTYQKSLRANSSVGKISVYLVNPTILKIFWK